MKAVQDVRVPVLLALPLPSHSASKSPDTLNQAKFLLARTYEPQDSHFPFPSLLMAMLQETLPRHYCSSTNHSEKVLITTHTGNTVYPMTLQIRAGLTHHNRDISLLPAPVWGFCGEERRMVKGKNGQLSQNCQDEDNHSENCKILFQCSHSLTSCQFLQHPHSSPAAILLPQVPHVQISLKLHCSTLPQGM